MGIKRLFLWIVLLAVCTLQAGPIQRQHAIVAKKRGAAGADTDWFISQAGGSTIAPADFVGCKFTVAGVGITATELGVYMASTDGYQANTPIQIRAANGTTIIASANVDCSDGLAGWHWVTLGSPAALSASTSYFLCVEPQFQSIRNSGTTVTTTAAASIDDAAFVSGGTFTAEGAGAGKSYGPVSFKYH